MCDQWCSPVSALRSFFKATVVVIILVFLVSVIVVIGTVVVVGNVVTVAVVAFAVAAVINVVVKVLFYSSLWSDETNEKGH